MSKVQTITGKVLKLSTDDNQSFRVFPTPQQAKSIADSHKLTLKIKPKVGVWQQMAIPGKILVLLARLLHSAPNVKLGVGTEVTAQYSGSDLTKLVKVGHHSMNKVYLDVYYKKPASVASSKSVSAKSVSAKEASSSSPSSKASSAQSASVSKSKAVASSTAASVVHSKSASRAQSLAVSAKVSSIQSSQATSVSLSDSVSQSVQQVRIATSQQAKSDAVAHAKAHSMAKTRSSIAMDVPASATTDSVSNSISRKLSDLDHYKASADDSAFYRTIKKQYQSLTSQPSDKIDNGLKHIYATENWHKFIGDQQMKAGKDFNRALNQGITNYRMNYALQNNIIPNNLDKPRTAKKHKKHIELHDKNIF